MSNINSISHRYEQHTFFTCFLFIIASQISIHVITENFHVSLGSMCLPIFLYLIEKFPVIKVTVISLTGLFIIRIAAGYFMGTSMMHVALSLMPEICFYLMQAGLYAIYALQRNNKYSLNTYFIPVFIFDYLSNCLEVFIRLHIEGFSLGNQLFILCVAAGRTLLVWGVLSFLDRYRIMLLHRSQIDRYSRLILLVSSLHGELVWLKKNVEIIENTMDTAYSLCHALKENHDDENALKALSVAKDVHEIKKEYMLIVQGMSDALERETNESGMSFDELLSIVEDSLNHISEDIETKLIITHEFDDNLYTCDPYFFFTIFRNLINNAMEASDKPELNMYIREWKRNNNYYFIIADDGSGINPAFTENIFDAGFSTKINYETGIISRGLGLPIVRDTVEQELEGEIDLLSHEDPDCENINYEGAIFRIIIPEDQLEVRS